MHQLFSVGEVARHQNISRQILIFYEKSVFSILPISTQTTTTDITVPIS